MYNTEETKSLIYTLEQKRISLLEVKKSTLKWHLLLPIIFALLLLMMFSATPVGLVAGGVTAIISFITYLIRIHFPFNEIKKNAKAATLAEIMQNFHPEVKYSYHADYQNGKSLIKSARLISANSYEEEDVIKGVMDKAIFYISEIELAKKNDKSRRTVFDGMLLHIKIPGRRFANSRIQSEPGLLAQLFGSYVRHPDYGFYYDTNDDNAFHQSLKSLFPFIRHLMDRQGDIRISTQGDEMLLMMESGMDFLDQPNISLSTSLYDKKFIEGMSKHINSLLFIVDSLANNRDSQEIEKRLELRALELIKKQSNA